MIKYSKIYLLTGIIKDRREIRFKEIRCSGKLLQGLQRFERPIHVR